MAEGILHRLLTDTWPAKAAQSALQALMLPGDVAANKFSQQPTTPGMWSDTDEGMQQHYDRQRMGRTTDLAGLVMGGSYAAAPAMSNATGMGIRAYHGSPHDFDKFSLKQIGTGEGAQAYGHGLYFAENEGVARGYRDALKKDMFYSPTGEMFDPQSQLKHLNIRVAARNNGTDLDATISRARELLPKAADVTRPMIEHDISILQRFKDAGGISQNPGRMYEVNINAKPEQFLDWDKPLSQQGDLARSAWDDFTTKRPEWRDPQTAGGQYANPTGKDFIGAYSEAMPHNPNDMFDYRRAFTNDMREAGIPGIKYLDQGSRGAGQGSSNYVVFDDKLIDILRKYGIAGASPLAALMAGGGNEAQTTQ